MQARLDTRSISRNSLEPAAVTLDRRGVIDLISPGGLVVDGIMIVYGE
jgi:hypothetical protein